VQSENRIGVDRRTDDEPAPRGAWFPFAGIVETREHEMHPYQLEVLASERRRELHAEAHRHHLTRHARHVAMVGTRPRARTAIAFGALTAFARRWRRKVRVVFAPERSYLLDDRTAAGSSVRARNREPIRGF
jgi:hypothetical protein